MKPYKVYIDITNRYSVEVHGHDQDDVQAQAEKLSKHQIEDGGDYTDVVGIEVVDIESMLPPDDEDEPIVQEAIEEEPKQVDDIEWGQEPKEDEND